MGQTHSRSPSVSSSVPDEADIAIRAATLEELYQAVYDAETNPRQYNELSPNGENGSQKGYDPHDQGDLMISGITSPGAAPHIHHLSELIDPYDLLTLTADSSLDSYPAFVPGHYGPYPVHEKPLPVTIETPCGGVLSAAEFVARPDRPLAIRERQESIQRALERAQRDALQRQAAEQAQHDRKGSKSSNSSSRSKLRKGNHSSIAEKSRKGSADSNMTTSSSGSSRSWEHMRIEEGQRDYDELLRKKQVVREKAKGTGLFKCFND